MRKALVIFSLSILALHESPAQQFPQGFVNQLVAEGLDPTDMVIAPDGRIFITIKSGKILIVENGTLLANPFLSMEVDNYNERGLGHMVLDPEFELNNFYYVYYTVPNTNRNRVSRFTANGNFTLAGSEMVLLDLDIMSGTIHNGGDMVFDSHGKLYIAVGDGADANAAQSMNNLHGKILRINPDGSIPSDNPFFNTATGKNRAIYALGFRNPFSMDLQPGTDRIFACDVGQGTWEEVNDVLPGMNYGWPLIEGNRTNQTPPASYHDPVHAYNHSEGCAIVGAAFYNPVVETFPSQYVGQFFFADYCNGYIKTLNPETAQVSSFATGINRPLAIVTAPDGTMYYIARAGLGGGSEQDNTSTNNGTLWKLTYTGSGAPFVASHPKDALVAVGEGAEFIILASGAQPLSYQGQVNGTDIPEATSSSYTFTNAQLSDDGHEFACIISNSFGSVSTNAATLTVTSNTRPLPVIVTPATGAAYRAGQELILTGTATDAEDGLLSASNLEWKIDFHHDTHHHPAMAAMQGQPSVIYLIPQVGETSENVWYRVYLTATDSEGLSNTVHTDIHPETSTITLETQPAGLNLLLDGQPVTTPHTFTSVIGIMRTLGAPFVQEYDGTQFLFNSWSDVGQPREFNVETSETPANYTATFSVLPTGNGTGLKGYYYTHQARSFNNPPTLIRTDPVINFDWGGGSPGPGVSSDYFSVRWLGEVMTQFTSTYTFSVIADDGVRFWVNDQLIIDKWIPQAATEWSGTIDLVAEQHYPIKLEFFEDAGAAVIKLLWSTLQMPKQIIPTSQLFTDLVTSVNESTDSGLKVYPTLVTTEVTLEQSSHTPFGEWCIINVLGQIVAGGSLEKGSQQISMQDLPAGMYILRTTGKHSATFRLLKQ